MEEMEKSKLEPGHVDLRHEISTTSYTLSGRPQEGGGCRSCPPGWDKKPDTYSVTKGAVYFGSQLKFQSTLSINIGAAWQGMWAEQNRSW